MNYESYLKLISCLIFVLTDEHPEVRLYVVNQGLNLLFSKALVLQTASIKGIVIRDSNDFLAVSNLFDCLA